MDTLVLILKWFTNLFLIPLMLIIGGALWECFKFFFPEVKRYYNLKVEAKNKFYENIDSVLKAASELYGKLESLAKEDFSTFTNPIHSNSNDVSHNQKYIYYLFSQFWANIEYIRIINQYSTLTKIDKGIELLRFIETIESRQFRILDRSIQRIIGECMIENSNSKFKVMTMNVFIQSLDNPTSEISIWVKKLEVFLFSVDDKKNRQKILVFGIILAMLIDNFDPEYKIVRRREIFVNKLSAKSKIVINHRLIEHYLPFIKSNKKKYY